MLCKCGKHTKNNKPLCYYCYLTEKSGSVFAVATSERLKRNNVERHKRNSWRRTFNKWRCRGCGEDPYCYCGDGTPYSY